MTSAFMKFKLTLTTGKGYKHHTFLNPTNKSSLFLYNHPNNNLPMWLITLSKEWNGNHQWKPLVHLCIKSQNICNFSSFNLNNHDDSDHDSSTSNSFSYHSEKPGHWWPERRRKPPKDQLGGYCLSSHHSCNIKNNGELVYPTTDLRVSHSVGNSAL